MVTSLKKNQNYGIGALTLTQCW